MGTSGSNANLMMLRTIGYMDNAMESYSRAEDWSVTTASGTSLLNYFTAYRSVTVTRLGTACRGTAGTGITAVRRGIYTVDANDNATLVARTATSTDDYAATWSEYVKPLDATGGFPTSFTFIEGQRYALAHFMTFTGTAASLKGFANNNPSNLNARAPKLCANFNAQVDLAMTYDNTGTTGNGMYMYALP